MNLTGRVAIVTGGAQGLGRATVEAFVEAHARGVIIADVQADQAESTAQEIMAAHKEQVIAIPTDVCNPSQVEAMVQATLDRFGRIDILVNNAGMCPIVEWDSVTLEDWNRVLAVNVTGMFLCTRAVIPCMKTQKYGRIVYVSSPAGRVGSIIAHVAYGVSKGGCLALMKSVAKGFAKDGVLANAILPGPIDTPLSRSFGEEFWVSQQEKPLLKRHASPKEVADAVLFLVSDRSTYITGHELWVDGGWSLG